MLEIVNLSKHFGGIVALDEVSFSIKPGSVHGLLGENGAGKSTLAKILSGLYIPDSGEIHINGQQVFIPNATTAASLGIALIPQELELVPYFSAAENIYLGSEPCRGLRNIVDWPTLHSQCKELLNRLEIEIDPEVQVASLSVSEQQQVVIARALAKDARILIMDEPTARLGHHEVENVLASIKRLRQQGLTIVYISHHLDEVFQVCDSVTVLRDGQMVGNAEISQITPDRVIQLMVARDLEQRHAARSTEFGDEVLRVENVARQGILEEVSFNLRRKEILGIGGLVGAGRTELVRAILGIDKRDSGRIYVSGEEVSIRSIQDSIRHGLVLVPEERRQQGLVLSLSVKANITLPNLRQFTQLLGYLDSSAEERSANALVDRLRIKTPSIGVPTSSLSGGNQQKVVLAKWLDTKAKVFIFDEPTRGIDVGTKSEIHRLIRELAHGGAGVIVVSSEIPELLNIADRVIVMREGEITAILEDDAITSEEIMRNAVTRQANGSAARNG